MSFSEFKQTIAEMKDSEQAEKLKFVWIDIRRFIRRQWHKDVVQIVTIIVLIVSFFAAFIDAIDNSDQEALDDLGMAEYEAIEAFVRYEFNKT